MERAVILDFSPFFDGNDTDIKLIIPRSPPDTNTSLIVVDYPALPSLKPINTLIASPISQTIQFTTDHILLL